MSFFKAYDMRGTFGADFDLNLVYRVGRALPQVVKGTRWLVGRDGRCTSPEVRSALVAGLRESGAHVTDLGVCTTPMVYFFTAEDGYDGSVMVTASHNPASDNGLKVSARGARPVGYANGLDEVERLAAADSAVYPGGESPADAQVADAAERYADWLLRRAPASLFDGLDFAVDCSSGVASLLARRLFPRALIVNDEIDGRFPCHSPNPLKAEAREQLAALVRERKLDCGVIFDGDADRCMFVDENGEFVQPDYLVPVVAAATLKAAPGGADGAAPKIIHDVRTSRGAIEEIVRMGCSPLMVPVGHAFAKPILRETGALCGGELAGHYYFREFHCCDSGMLAAMRILSGIAAAKADGVSFSKLMEPVSGAYENSGELNFKVSASGASGGKDAKDAAIERVLKAAAERLPPEISRSGMDGWRIEFADGWINVRKSNTEPYLRLIAERRRAVGEWVDILRDAIG